MHAWLPVVLYAAIIFGLSSMHGTGAETIAHYDKIIHAVEYLLFAALIARALRMRVGASTAVVVAVAAAAASLYGVTDELHQALVPGRDSSVGDWLADTVGAVAGAALGAVLFRRQQGAS